MFAAPEAEHEPGEEEILQKYIRTLGALRIRVLEHKKEFENAFLRKDIFPYVGMDNPMKICSKILF